MLLKSIDDGVSWGPAQNGVGAHSGVEYITSDNAGVLHAVAFYIDNNDFFPEIYSSTDGAETWNPVNVTGFPTLTNATFNTINYTGSGFILTYVPGTLTVTEPMVTSLEDPLNQGVKVYPNPTSGTVNIETALKYQELGRVQVFNAMGREMLSGQLETRTTFNLRTYPPGIYWLKIVQDQKVYVLTVLRE